MKSNFNKILTFALAFIICLIFIGASGGRTYGSGEVPDPLGSWSQINSLVARPAGWKQIVTDTSAFQWGGISKDPYKTDIYNYSGCNGGSHTSKYYDLDYGTYPLIDGSTVLVPMAAEFAWQYLDFSNEFTRTFVHFNTTSDAYYRLILDPAKENLESYRAESSGVPTYGKKNTTTYYRTIGKKTDIVLATYPSVEQLDYAEKHGVSLVIEPVCYDSFVFITRGDNPVDSLTVEQVQKIYSGEITNWQEVGGDDLEIVAYQREKNSGSQTAMEEMVMQGMQMTKPPMAQVAAGMGRLIDVVAGYEDGDYESDRMSIGYTYKYYVDRLYTSNDIKILKIDGVTPSDENVRNGSYAFIASYNAVIRAEDINATGGKFMNWMLSDEGQRCIAQAGYVTLLSLT